jgi:hypothetical protein
LSARAVERGAEVRRPDLRLPYGHAELVYAPLVLDRSPRIEPVSPSARNVKNT